MGLAEFFLERTLLRFDMSWCKQITSPHLWQLVAALPHRLSQHLYWCGALALTFCHSAYIQKVNLPQKGFVTGRELQKKLRESCSGQLRSRNGRIDWQKWTRRRRDWLGSWRMQKQRLQSCDWKWSPLMIRRPSSSLSWSRSDWQLPVFRLTTTCVATNQADSAT